MSEPVLITLITTLGALVTAIIVEIIKRGRAQKATDEKIDAVLAQINPNSGKSLHDAVKRIERDVRDVKTVQHRHGERLAAVEVRVSDHLARS